MSIPIPIILALLAQKNSNLPKQSNASSALVTTSNTKPKNITRTRSRKDMARKLSGVAQLVGGAQGAKLSSAAKVMGAVDSLNSPMNALSLLAKSRGGSPINNLLTGGQMPNVQGNSSIYNNIGNMLSGMDSDKKEQLLSMAKSIMNPDN